MKFNLFLCVIRDNFFVEDLLSVPDTIEGASYYCETDSKVVKQSLDLQIFRKSKRENIVTRITDISSARSVHNNFKNIASVIVVGKTVLG